MINEENVVKAWEEKEYAASYIGNIGLTRLIPLCTAFYEGKQWSKPTEENKDLPRPVFNHVKNSIDNIVSNVLTGQTSIVFTSSRDNGKATKLTNFTTYQLAEIGMSSIDIEFFRCALIKGTAIKYYYWDENSLLNNGRYEGGLRCQCIDPLKFYVSDPTEKDIQKQDWIMYETRESVDVVKKQCKVKKEREKIQADDLETDYLGVVETEEKNKCTVLVKFFRKDKEVVYQKFTKTATITEPISLNPNLNKKLAKQLLEEEKDLNVSTQDTYLEEPTDMPNTENKFSLYPFVSLVLYPREKSFYGISEVESMIEVQKAINFNIAFGELNMQSVGVPKYLAKQGALRDQVIDNNPGQRIIDYYQGNGWGVTTLQAQPFSQGALQFTPALIDLLKQVTGTSDFITGDMVSKDLSGTAIGLMQAQAKKPLGIKRKLFLESKVKEGRVLQQYYTHYYENKRFEYTFNAKEKTNAMLNNGMLLPDSTEDIFNGKDFRDIPFFIKIEAGEGTEYSEAQMVSILNSLVQMGQIDTETLIHLLPDTIFPKKEELEEFIRVQKQSELAQATTQNAQLEEQNKQLEAYISQQDKVVKQLSKQIKESDNNLIRLQQEYATKISQANAIINQISQGVKSNKD